MVARNLGMAVVTCPVAVVAFDAGTAVVADLEKEESDLGLLDRVGWP